MRTALEAAQAFAAEALCAGAAVKAAPGAPCPTAGEAESASGPGARSPPPAPGALLLACSPVRPPASWASCSSSLPAVIPEDQTLQCARSAATAV